MEDDWWGGPASSLVRLVLPRAKRDRLVERAAALALQQQHQRLRTCSVAGCGAECLPVLLIEAEVEGVLCPVHQLVLLDGSPVEGQPMLATTAW
jgi:hypothetical protein